MKHPVIRIAAVYFLLTIIPQTLNAQPFHYPAARKVDQKDTYFGTTIDDPYRWLEDDRSEETAAWVTEENKVTEAYLSSIPFREEVRKRMTSLWNFAKSSVPFKGGKQYFVYTNDGLQNQFVLKRLPAFDKPGIPFLDPNTMSSDGTINVNAAVPSKDGSLLAYSIARAGSDWNEIYVKSVFTGTQMKDTIRWVKFSSISWRDKGFYYSRYPEPSESDKLKGKNAGHQIYYHFVGTPQSKDKLIYQERPFPLRNFNASVTDDSRYLIIYGSEGTSGNSLIVRDLQNPKKGIVKLVRDFQNDYEVIDNDSSWLLVRTNKNASRYRLVWINADDPAIQWKELIPEQEDVLQEATVGNNQIIVRYMHDAYSVLKVYSKAGKFLYDIPLPTIGTVDQLSASRKDANLFYSLSSFTMPSTIYRYDLKERKQSVFFQPQLAFNAGDYETKQVFYTSKDGTKIPMFIVHKKGLVLDGNNPVLLFGYGGFNVSKSPEFKIERLVFLEKGGIFAQPCIRGGGEYGEAWHEAGTKLKKQNVFDDFIAAGEYLVKEKYTAPRKIGIGGRSNGGLLVGACMLQRPDLFGVALPTVGVLDMLRYHKFTIGWAWKGDYGSSEDSTQFHYLLNYSPLHNIREGVDYPATLVTTGDHDDRVVPAHSFKFTATLQEKYKGDQPVMIRVDVNSGHASTTALGSSKPVAKQIEEQSDIFTFLMKNLGMSW